jgi:hypothetical protein
MSSNNMKTNTVTTNSSMGFSHIYVESIRNVDVNGTKGKLTITEASSNNTLKDMMKLNSQSTIIY